MSFTKKVTDFTTKPENKAGDVGKTQSQTRKAGVRININKNNIFAPQDYATIINAFESGSAEWEEEDYNSAYHYKDVYSTKQFSKRTQDQLNYYPGMHQTTRSAKDDPSYIEAKRKADDRMSDWRSAMSSPESFQGALRSRQQDFDYAKVFGSSGSAKDRAIELGKIHTECVPCFKRLTDIEGLLPNGDILEIHGLNAKIRLDFLDDIKNLFGGPGMYIDICEMLKLLSSLCPQDLFAMVVVFSQYLAKLNLQVKFNIDFMISLVGSILSPFLDALSQWLDKWMQLLLEPVICVVDHINEIVLLAQNAKIPFSKAKHSVEADINIASMAHKNASIKAKSGLSGENKNAWADFEAERFNTPDNQKYNTPRPSSVDFGEDSRRSVEEAKEIYVHSFDANKREERNEEFRQRAIERSQERKETEAEYLKRKNRNGTRWSKDNIPESEKDTKKYSFNSSLPVEKQDPIKSADRYYTPHAMISSVVQIRNLLQTSVNFVQDWFTYITQMVYDLLGTEIGWMKNKTGTTQIKSEIIQILKVIKAIISAISKNGLKCGSSSNLDPEQVKFITENELNNLTDYNFNVDDRGDIQVILPGQKPKVDTKNNSQGQKLDEDAEVPTATEIVDSSVGNIKTNPHNKQTPQKSSIIVKSCFNQTDIDNIQKVSEWIDYYERRLSDEANA